MGVRIYSDVKVVFVSARQAVLNGFGEFGHDVDTAVAVCKLDFVLHMEKRIIRICGKGERTVNGEMNFLP